MDPRNFKIEDVTLNYARLDKAVSPFGAPQYELQIATPSEEKVKELEANHVPFKRKDGALVKDKEGNFVASLRRKAIKADGSDNGKVRVVNGDLTPMSDEDIRQLGNGSKGNVIVFQYSWEQAGRSGIASSLTAIQVTDFERFVPTGGVDFTPVGVTSSEPVEPTKEAAELF